MSKPKVFLMGGDGLEWALDEDLRLARRALERLVAFTDLNECEVVHSVWWEPLLALPQEQLVGKRIICQMSGEPYRYLSLPRFRHAIAMVGRWIAQSSQADRQLAGLGLVTTLVPYTVDVGAFYPLPVEHAQIVRLREQWDIPTGRYLVGNFHRDSEGSDLNRPKLMKGPDIFVEIVDALCKKGYPIHVVLAGPRRHWLRNELAARDIPFTFIGEVSLDDDIRVNRQPYCVLNALYNLVDIYLVTSRSEGGPRSILEAAAAKCKIVSTRVGLAEDVLNDGCLYASPVQAVEIIERDIQTNLLAASVDDHYRRVHQHHRPEQVAPLFEQLYACLEDTPVYEGSIHLLRRQKPARSSRWRRIVPALKRKSLRVGVWHRFVSPPYGGGNQFMLALRKALRRRGVDVVDNGLSPRIDVYLLNSIHFDVERFLDFGKQHSVRVVHRIDGPIHLIRGRDREKDELAFELNARFASATVLQSAWSYQHLVDMGFRPVNPVMIHNAADSTIFHPRGRISFDRERKVRLISTSWSDNPRKGGPIYKWIEEHLDLDRFEYTFVGRASVQFQSIRHIPPVPSEELADILRQHDIYITASRNDPCSNAVLEALACGLPVLYFDDGGHPELVGYGGLPFSDVGEILSQLDILVGNYEMFQSAIAVPTIDDVADRYLALLKEVAES